MNSTLPYIPLPKHVFLRARGRPWDNLSIPGAIQENLEPTFLHSESLFPWFKPETRRWNLKLTLRPHPWIKPGTQKMRFQSALNKTFCSKPPSTHPPTIRPLQTRKITKLGLLSLPPLVFNKRFTASELKSISILSPPGKRSRIAGSEL